MTKPDSNQSAFQRLAQRVQESGGDFSALMQQLRRLLAGTGGMHEQTKSTLIDDFDAALAEALGADQLQVCAPPVVQARAKADEAKEWEEFEAELEQELIREFKL